MKDKLLSNPSHVAKIGYNSFDMSQSLDFTCAPAMLLPVYYDFLNPGDKVRCNAVVQLRTNPLETAANFSADVRLDWFAVPIEQIYKYFGNQYYNIQDIGTDYIDVRGFQPNSTLPCISVNTLMNWFVNNYPATYSLNTETFNYSFYEITDFSSMTDAQKLCCINDSFRLLSHLGIPVEDYYDLSDMSSEGGITNMSINWFLGAAYQKIYYDYFRLSDRQENFALAYNMDSLVEYGNRGNFQYRIPYLFKLHYIPYKKDFMTNTFVSPLQGSQDIGSLNGSVQWFNNWLTGAEFTTGIPSSGTTLLPFGNLSDSNISPTTVKSPKYQPTSAQGSSQSQVSGFVSSIFNPTNMRSLFAMEKALEITRRSGKHYDAQTLAHWGVKVPEGIAGEVLYLGSQHQPLVVGDIISTANSTNDSGDLEPLGTIAGKGYSGRNVEGAVNRPINFEAKSHCVLMCIFSVQPDVRYTQRGMDKLNALVNVSDFLHPEFDNLGMQPLFGYQLQTSDASTYMTVVDWQYAYSEVKHKFNRVITGVRNGATRYNWVPQVDLNGSIAFSSLERFIARPSWLNNSLVYTYHYMPVMAFVDDTWTGRSFDTYLYQSDPFIVSAYFDCQKASKMSTYSLANL